MKHQYSTYALIIFGSVLFFGFIIALDSGDLDLICNVNGSVLKRVNGTWVCGTDLTGNNTQTFTDTNESVRFNALVGSDCPAGYKAIGVNVTGGILCSEDLTGGSAGTIGYNNLTQNNNNTNKYTIKDSYLTSKCVQITGSAELCDGDDNTGSDDQTCAEVSGADCSVTNELDFQRTKFNHTQFMNNTGNWTLKDGKYYLASNPSGYISDGNTNWDNSYGFITNATMNKSVSCTDIIGGSDGDYCTDATGAGSGDTVKGDNLYLYNTTTTGIKTLTMNITKLNLTINKSIAGTAITWSQLDNYPTACGVGDYISGVGDTLTCASDEYIFDGQVTGDNNKKLTLESISTNITILFTDKTNIMNTTQFNLNKTVRDSFLVSKCVQITGSAGLCDGDDAGGASGSTPKFDLRTRKINVSDGTNADLQGLKRDTDAIYFDSINVEFLTATLTTWGELLGFAVSSGTMAAVAAGNMSHLGIVSFSDSTTGGGGYAVQTGTSAFLINGSEKAMFVFNDVSAKTTYKIQMGFLDSATQADSTDGCYFKVENKKFSARCANSAVFSNSNTNYTITRGQWYKAIMEVNKNATKVNFTLWNSNTETSTLLWNRTVSAQIPIGKARQTGFGVIATESTTDAAAIIMYMDYIGLKIPRRIRR